MQFWYLDTDATTLTAAAAANLGIRARGTFMYGGATVQTTIRLNRCSLFEEGSDRLLPPRALEFEIRLQSVQELIWQNDGTARRIVVRTFELWVPRLRFTSDRQKLVNENFLKPKTWTYMA